MTTGKEDGQTGGRLSGGSRASTALKKVRIVTVVGPAPRKRSYPPSPLRRALTTTPSISSMSTRPPQQPRTQPRPTLPSGPSTYLRAPRARCAPSLLRLQLLQLLRHLPRSRPSGTALMALSQSAGSSSERKAAPAAAGKQRMKPAHRGAGVAPLPPAVRGSALVVVPSVSYGAGKDYYTVSVNVSSNHCVRSVGLGLLGAYITCQSSNALLTTYSICLHGVAALARIPPTYVQLFAEIHAQHTQHALARHEFMVKSRCEPAIRSISHHVSQSRRRCPILWL